MSDSTFAKQHILDSSVQMDPVAVASVTRRINNHPAGGPDVLDALGLVDA